MTTGLVAGNGVSRKGIGLSFSTKICNDMSINNFPISNSKLLRSKQIFILGKRLTFQD